jgi:hypothetical protein
MYLGGDNQTIGEKQKRVVKTLWPLFGRDLGIRWQCRCGTTVYVKYRGRFYCRRCGSRITRPDAKIVGKGDTFRKCYDAATKVVSPKDKSGSVEKVKCPKCSRKVRVRNDGTLPNHNLYSSYQSTTQRGMPLHRCPWSGKPYKWNGQ